MITVSLRKGRHEGSHLRLNQGGTAKRKLSPLEGAGVFYFNELMKGGGRLESDLVELDRLGEMLNRDQSPAAACCAAYTDKGAH